MIYQSTINTLTEEELSYPDKQSRCISQTLRNNNFSTVNQEGDKFIISFNSDNNYLNVEKKELLHRNSEIPWNITKNAHFYFKN